MDREKCQEKNIFILQIDFSTKPIKRDLEGHFILKGIIRQEDINIINVYIPNIGAPTYIWKFLEGKFLEDLKKDIDKNTHL